MDKKEINNYMEKAKESLKKRGFLQLFIEYVNS